MEKRILGTHELRASKSGDKMTVSGYAATYNTLSKDLGGFRERIAPGAFKRILATNPDVVMLFNHDVNSVLGRTTAGTLRLREDSRGLAFECDLPNTVAGRDVWESVQRGDLNGCSFAFKLASGMDQLSEESVEDDSIRGAVKRTVKMIVRTIKDFANLFDCSVVTDPAYLSTSVGVARSLVVGAELRSRVELFRKPARKPWAERFPKRPDILNVDEAAAVRNRRRDILNDLL
jgi:HK97 family phage prohead protease